MKILTYFLILFIPFLPQAQQDFYIFDMSDFLSNMEKDWSIGNGIDTITGEFVGAYFEVTVQDEMNMNGFKLEVMNSSITVFGDSINSGIVTKRFETSNLYFAPTLGVEQINKPLEIVMYPNPSNDFVYFEGDYMDRIIIYDINAVLISRSKPRSNRFALSVSSFSSGTYMVQIFSDNKKGIFKKLIIK